MTSLFHISLSLLELLTSPSVLNMGPASPAGGVWQLLL